MARSIIQGGELGGINTDPLFIRDPDRAAGDLGDLHLRQYAPGIDAGNDALAAGLTTDLDGLSRLFDVTAVANNGSNIVDMGAYELNSQVILPVADAGGPYMGDEGSPVALDGSGSTSAHGLVAYAWDCTGDGTYDVVSSSPTGDSCTYPDNGSYLVRLVVTDTGGLTGTGMAAVTVHNVAPVVTAPADQAPAAGVSEGTESAFKLGSFSDVGIDDNPWQVEVDWGDGSPDTTFPRDAQGSLPDRKHTYATNGNYTVKVTTVTDKDGDAGSATFAVSVANVAPTVTAPSDQTAIAGASKSFALGSFADPGADSPWAVTVKWGDGSANNQFNVNSPGNLPNRSHTYAAAGGYTVTVKVDDGDAIGRDSFRVTVSAAPVETGGVEGTVYEDSNGNGKPDKGEGVPGASVKLSKVSAAVFENPVTTDKDGKYAFSDVPVGEYKLTVAAVGYKSPAAVSVTVQKDATEPVAAIVVEKKDGAEGLSVYLPAVQSTSATRASKVRGPRGSLERNLYLPAIVR